MKKVILTAVLIVAVLTSLTAGTLASYVLDLPAINGNVAADAFTFEYGITTKASFNAGLKMKPGDTKDFILALNQNSESDVRYTIVPSLPESSPLLKVLKLDVVTEGGSSVLENGKYTQDKAAGTDPVRLRVRVTWPATNPNNLDVAAAGTSTVLTVNVNGAAL